MHFCLLQCLNSVFIYDLGLACVTVLVVLQILLNDHHFNSFYLLILYAI